MTPSSAPIARPSNARAVGPAPAGARRRAAPLRRLPQAAGALALAAACLLAVAGGPSQAQAQEWTMWSAHFTAGENRKGAVGFKQSGGLDDRTPNAHLSSAGFKFPFDVAPAPSGPGGRYFINQLSLRSGTLVLGIQVFAGEGGAPAAGRFHNDRFKLYIGGRSFKLGDARLTPERYALVWTGTGLRWREGQVIHARLTAKGATSSNRAATGKPAVVSAGGFAESDLEFRPGQHLVADTSNIKDRDGLCCATYDRFRFQWIRVDGDGNDADEVISGATGRVYEIRGEDAGNKVRVRAIFWDDKGSQEVIDSEAFPKDGTILEAKPRLFGPTSTTLPEADSRLRALTVSPGSLDPGFTSGTREYQVLVGNATSQITLQPRARDGDATITYRDVNDATLADVAAADGFQVSLAVGLTTVKVRVTAGDDVSEKRRTSTYTLHILRAAAAPASCDAIWCANLTVGFQALTNGDVFGNSEDDFGRLAPNSFTIDGTTHTVPELSALDRGRSGEFDELDLSVDPNLPDGDYTLVLGSSRFDFSGGRNQFEFPNPAIDWSIGDVVAVRLEERTEAMGQSEPRSPTPQGLTVALESAPERHDGEEAFEVRIRFSDDITANRKKLPQAFEVDGGSIEKADTVDGRRDRWKLRVRPDGEGAVTLALAAGRKCGSGGVPCAKTPDGKGRITLSAGLTVTVPGPAPAEPKEPAGAPLTASVDHAPVEHTGPGANGQDEFVVRVAFSDAVTLNRQAMKKAFTKTNANVRDARRVDGRGDLWRLYVRPHGYGDVTLHLGANADCADEAQPCTSDGEGLAEGLTVSVPGPARVSIADARAKERDDSSVDFTVSLNRPATKPTSVRYATADGTAAAGEDYTETAGTLAFALGEQEKTIQVPLLADTEAEGDETFTLTLSHASAGRLLDGTATGTIENADPPLTASVDHAPAEHTGPGAHGKDEFVVRVAFSEPVTLGRKALRKAFTKTNANIRDARRVDGRGDLWRFYVRPHGYGDVTLQLGVNVACGDEAQPCTRDGRGLGEAFALTVPGPAGISVADASAPENTGAAVAFTVSLHRTATKRTSVRYATADGSARAGEDYTDTSGTLVFALGETTRTVAVPVLDDAVDEGEETFTLTLSHVSAGHIVDGTATGTIENADPLQRDWLARFGRTVGNQAAAAIGERLAGGARETAVTLGGQPLALGGTAGPDPEAAAAAMSRWLRGEEEQAPRARSMSGRELLLASRFNLAAGGEDGAPAVGAWGRLTADAFDAGAGGLALEGDVMTAFLGADAAFGRWLGGIALGHAEGDGTFRQDGAMAAERPAGTIASTLTALYPYARYAATARLDVWAMAGIGQGTMTVDDGGAAPRKTDIAMRMGIVGATGSLLEPGPGGGLALAVRSDALVLRIDSDAVAGTAAAGGNLAAAAADVGRLRLIVEASRAFALDGGATVTPALEAGLRHDAGDAETGTGVEVGARVRYAGDGVALEGAVRGLVAHEATDYEEWGASAALRIDPGTDGRGLSLTLAPVWGAAGSATDRLWQARDAHGLAPDAAFRAGRRLEGEVGYGFGLARNLGGVTPFAGLSLGDHGQVVRSGVRWTLWSAMTVRVEGSHRGAAAGTGAEQRIGLTAQAHW